MTKNIVTEDQIREAAYQIWQEEGEPQGLHEEHWYRAKDALSAPRPRKKAAPKKAAAARAPAKKAAAKKPAAKAKKA